MPISIHLLFPRCFASLKWDSLWVLKSYYIKMKNSGIFFMIHLELNCGLLILEQRFITDFGAKHIWAESNAIPIWTSYDKKCVKLEVKWICWPSSQRFIISPKNGALGNTIILQSSSLNAFFFFCDPCYIQIGIPNLQLSQARFASNLSVGWQTVSPKCCTSVKSVLLPADLLFTWQQFPIS